jgi:hyaluronoglucosaminidase
VTQSTLFHIKGALEGFYGVYYTFEERTELLQFLGQQGYNLYIYGPKNDRQHRNRWREPYPDYVMKQFADNVAAAKEAGIAFCYSIGSGVDMSYSSEEEFRIITDKFDAFYRIGVRDFSILLDDISAKFKHEEDARTYGSFAEAHADVSNRLLSWLKQLDPNCTLSMCPTDYHGMPPFGDYIHKLGEKMDPEIDIFYTGPEICSQTIGHSEVKDFAKSSRRLPIVWDNYPVNDLDMRSELHIGPIRGRDAKLQEVSKGFVVNLMSECEASKIALLTFADYFRDPAGYQPDRSCDDAILNICGERSVEAFRRFAENSLYSCLGMPEAETLKRLTDHAMQALVERSSAVSDPAVTAFCEYVFSLDEACYHLKNRMDNTRLRNNLLPWIESLEHRHWMVKRAVEVLLAQEKGDSFEKPLAMMKESLENVRKSPKRMAAGILEPLAEYVLTRV